MNSDQIEAQHINSRKQYLTFTLGAEQYAVDILKVQEIRGWETLRELHDVPAYYKGVLDFRGSILPIIDLRIRFALENFEYNSTTVIIVISSGLDGSMMGLVVDAVSDVLSLAPSEIKSSPNMGSRIKIDYLVGMISSDQGMIMLVDSDRLVDKDELEVPDCALVAG